MAKLRRETGDGGTEMVSRSVSIRQVSSQLGVDESTLRYRLGRPERAPDGQRDRASVLDGWAEVVGAVLGRFGDPRWAARRPDGARPGWYFECWAAGTASRAATRRCAATCGGPMASGLLRRCAGWRRRPECRRSHDWFEWPAVVAGERCTLYGRLTRRNPDRAHVRCIRISVCLPAGYPLEAEAFG